MLSPTTRSLDLVFLEQLRGAVMGAPLPLGQRLLIAWPQTVCLMIAGTIVLFVAGYVVFQRQKTAYNAGRRRCPSSVSRRPAGTPCVAQPGAQGA